MKQKRVRMLNILVIIAVIAVIAGVMVASEVIDRRVVPNAGKLEAEQTSEPSAAPDTGDVPAATAEPAKAYLLVTVGGTVYEPIPMYEAGRYTVRRGDYVNVIEVTEDSIKMAESTCANQDCVEQGVVSLENRDDRVLRNMIICLPNDVALELYTYEEMLEVVQGYAEGLGK